MSKSRGKVSKKQLNRTKNASEDSAESDTDEVSATVLREVPDTAAAVAVGGSAGGGSGVAGLAAQSPSKGGLVARLTGKRGKEVSLEVLNLTDQQLQLAVNRLKGLNKAARCNDVTKLKAFYADEGKLIFRYRDGVGLSALHAAVEGDARDALTWLLKKGGDKEVNATDNRGRSPLFVAAQKQSWAAAHALLLSGARADTGVPKCGGDTALHLLVRMRWQPDLSPQCMEMALATADVNLLNSQRDAVLHSAAEHTEPSATQAWSVRFLLERGAICTAQNQDGDTPLHKACAAGGAEAARLLLEYAADATTTNRLGLTARQLAEQYERVAVISMFEQRAQRTLMLEAAAHDALQNGGATRSQALLETWLYRCTAKKRWQRVFGVCTLRAIVLYESDVDYKTNSMMLDSIHFSEVIDAHMVDDVELRELGYVKSSAPPTPFVWRLRCTHRGTPTLFANEARVDGAQWPALTRALTTALSEWLLNDEAQRACLKSAFLPPSGGGRLKNCASGEMWRMDAATGLVYCLANPPRIKTLQNVNYVWNGWSLERRASDTFNFYTDNVLGVATFDGLLLSWWSPAALLAEALRVGASTASGEDMMGGTASSSGKSTKKPARTTAAAAAASTVSPRGMVTRALPLDVDAVYPTATFLWDDMAQKFVPNTAVLPAKHKEETSNANDKESADTETSKRSKKDKKQKESTAKSDSTETTLPRDLFWRWNREKRELLAPDADAPVWSGDGDVPAPVVLLLHLAHHYLMNESAWPAPKLRPLAARRNSRKAAGKTMESRGSSQRQSSRKSRTKESGRESKLEEKPPLPKTPLASARNSAALTTPPAGSKGVDDVDDVSSSTNSAVDSDAKTDPRRPSESATNEEERSKDEKRRHHRKKESSRRAKKGGRSRKKEPTRLNESTVVTFVSEDGVDLMKLETAFEAIALFDCEASDDDELEFKKGDQIEIVDANDSEWWLGRARGRIGNVPSSFVKRVEEE